MQDRVTTDAPKERAHSRKLCLRRHESALRIEEKRTSFLFLLIPTLILLAFTYYPAVRLVELSFSDWNGVSQQYGYVGWNNYLKVFQDKNIIRSFLNTLAYVGISVIQTFLALYFAIILTSNIRGRNWLRSLFFIPYVLNGVAVSYMFNYVYSYGTNPINVILCKLGLDQYLIHWLSPAYFSNICLAFIGLWRFTGYGMVLYIGALQSIPKSHLEAAELDGANFWQKVRYMIIPDIRAVIGINLFLNLNGALQAYDQAFVITNGGPSGATETFVTASIKTAYDYHKYGKASAMGIVLLALVIVVEIVQNLLVEKRGE